MGWLSSRRVGAIVASLALVGCLVGLGWTWRHPTSLEQAGGFGHGADYRAVGDTFYAGMTFGEDGPGTVTIHDAKAIIVSGGSVADAEVLLCTLAADYGGWIGSANEDTINQDCDELVPVQGEAIVLDKGGRQQILLAVTMRKAGVIHIENIDLLYSDGWRRGWQNIGGEVFASTGELPENYES